VDAGRAHFRSMAADHGIAPGPDHYACMVDLLGRAGRLDEAVDMLSRSTTQLDATVWKAMLAACRVHGNAERAAEMVWRLDPEDAVPYVMLSNLYSRARRWADVARVRSQMKARGVAKEPGCSWVGVNGVTHLFHVEDRGHPRAAEIYAKVEEMTERIRAHGYVPDTGWALQDEEPDGRARGLAYHSERLAARSAGRRADPRVQEPAGVRRLPRRHQDGRAGVRPGEMPTASTTWSMEFVRVVITGRGFVGDPPKFDVNVYRG
jgi:pentatricopeptide repeat protein